MSQLNFDTILDIFLDKLIPETKISVDKGNKIFGAFIIDKLDLSLGFSHPVIYEVPKEIKVSSEKSKIPNIILESYDKQLLGEVAAKIRSFRKPEPYKGKGIRYHDEVVRRKAGKTAAKA